MPGMGKGMAAGLSYMPRAGSDSGSISGPVAVA